jgi:hypothetical protein
MPTPFTGLANYISEAVNLSPLAGEESVGELGKTEGASLDLDVNVN